ncbi:MAG: glycosyltransferase family protein, partial [Acidimicrobiales bacterium]
MAVGARAMELAQFVFCVQGDDLASGRNDVRAAAGLGHALAERGYGGAIVGRERWSRMPHADLVISLSPRFDPARLPRRTSVIAWICDQIDEWSTLRQLSSFDAVLTSSHAGVEVLEEDFGGPVGMLPTGVDVGLFRPHPTRRTTDAAVYLDKVKRPSYFTLPDLYRNALVLIDHVGSPGPPFGAPLSRLLESLACGAMPVTRHGHGLAEVGLEEVPVYETAPDLDRVVRELRADPRNTMATGARLGAMVRAEHSWERRASEFLQHVEPLLLAGTDDPHAVARPATLGFFPD